MHSGLLASSSRRKMPSDGCTGFQWAEQLFSIHACCVAHDLGGTDGALLDCLMSNAPEWLWPIVALSVALMVLVRPLYRLIKPKGSARR